MTIVDEQHQAAEQEWLTAWLVGPTRTRLNSLPPQIGDPAPDLELPDTTGKRRRLSEFWQTRPALLLFLRHFGCSCLAGRWEKLKEELPAYEEAGAQVVAICQGEPERRSYEIYGLLEGTPAQILHDFAWTPGDQATGEKLVTSRRSTERAMVDNPWQLPGEFVVATDGRLALIHRYQYCEDFPPKTVLIGAIQAARG